MNDYSEYVLEMKALMKAVEEAALKQEYDRAVIYLRVLKAECDNAIAALKEMK